MNLPQTLTEMDHIFYHEFLSPSTNAYFLASLLRKCVSVIELFLQHFLRPLCPFSTYPKCHTSSLVEISIPLEKFKPFLSLEKTLSYPVKAWNQPSFALTWVPGLFKAIIHYPLLVEL